MRILNTFLTALEASYFYVSGPWGTSIKAVWRSTLAGDTDHVARLLETYPHAVHGK